ncbi:MAG TPA: kelch repeat-containing protein [Stellaceae bacterium]|nr:kelch repeat-containing protein [Stellaceae bacterium]
MKHVVVGAVAAIVVGFAVAALAQTADRGTWSTRASLPTQRNEVGVAALDGKIYVLGGTALGRFDSPLNQEYDPATDRWRDRAPLPHGQSHIGVAGLRHRLYAIGGFTNIVHVGAVVLCFVYDPASDSWQPIAPLSSPRGSVGVAVVGGKLHAIGGRGLDKVTVGTHEVYDPVTGKWSSAAPLPTPRDHIGVVAVGGKIHVIGGRTANTTDNTNLHDVYDPATDRWTAAAPLPTARSSGAAVLYHGLVLYAGGECKKLDPSRSNAGGEPFDENEAYDPNTGNWRTLTQLPAARHAFGAAAVGRYAYFAAGAIGCGGGPVTDQLLVFSLR